MSGRPADRALRAPAALLAAALALVLPACHVHGRKRSHLEVGPGMAALRAAFNADAGHPRILMLVSPS